MTDLCGDIKGGTYATAGPILACELEQGHLGMHRCVIRKHWAYEYQWDRHLTMTRTLGPGEPEDAA